MKEGAMIPEDEGRFLPCSRCGVKTRHKVLTCYIEDVQEEQFGLFSWEEYAIVSCGGCGTTAFARIDCCQEFLNDAESSDPEAIGVFVSQYEVYPTKWARKAALLGKADSLPPKIGALYGETKAAFANEMPVLSGVGIRAVLEAVCKDKVRGTSSQFRDLEKRIDSLVAKGLITQEGAKILHSLRFMGNKAAHEVKAHNEDELSAAFAVLEHLLQAVYVIPTRARQLPKKRSKIRKTASKP